MYLKQMLTSYSESIDNASIFAMF